MLLMAVPEVRKIRSFPVNYDPPDTRDGSGAFSLKGGEFVQKYGTAVVSNRTVRRCW